MKERLRELLSWINQVRGGVIELCGEDYIRKERIVSWIKQAIKCSEDQVYTVIEPHFIPEFENSLYRHSSCKFCYILLFRDESHNAQQLTSHLENSLIIRFLRKKPATSKTTRKHNSDGNIFKLLLPPLKGAELVSWVKKELEQNSLSHEYTEILIAQSENLDELSLLIKKLSLCTTLETRPASEVIFNLLRNEHNPRKILKVLKERYEEDPSVIFPVLGYLVKRNISSGNGSSLAPALQTLKADSLLKGHAIDKFAVIENLILQSHLKG